MDWQTRTDALLVLVAAYFAVMPLVRLMRRRRDELVADVQRQVEARRKMQRRAAEEEVDEREAA